MRPRAGTAKFEAVAVELRTAQREARQVRLATERYPWFDAVPACQVAGRIPDQRLAEGARAAGRKIGFTNPNMRAR